MLASCGLNHGELKLCSSGIGVEDKKNRAYSISTTDTASREPDYSVAAAHHMQEDGGLPLQGLKRLQLDSETTRTWVSR